MKNIIAILLVAVLSMNRSANAQFTWATIGVDGLTCSACTRSVEMSIRKLNFVDSVVMNLEHTEGKITFKKGAKVEIDKIAKAVNDAGFSLRSLYAGINIDKLKPTDDLCWTFENNNYHFIKIPADKQFRGILTLRFIGEKYLSKKEFKNWKMYCNDHCSPSAEPIVPYSKSYYVTLL